MDNNPDATVFFHDYHLYLAPRMVRELRPEARLAHFVHIPWPVDWTTLPRELRLALHEGLLANDVVAFHTERWARNFERSCADLDCGTDRTLVTHHPIVPLPGDEAGEILKAVSIEECLRRAADAIGSMLVPNFSD